MKEWYSISELLAAGLTNFPSSDKGITKKANRENWRKRQRKGVKGKTFEYHVSSMPSFVQEALCGKLIEPKEWFTAFELVGVDGLPTLPSNVTRLATKNGWLSRQVKGKRGVAFEYHYSALPFEVQQALSFIGTSEKEWFSANELVGLRGLPATPQGINKKARTQHWEKRSKNGVQGRAIEYHYSSLPEDVQQALSIVGISEIDLLIHYFNTSSLEGKKAIMATAKAMVNLND